MHFLLLALFGIVACSPQDDSAVAPPTASERAVAAGETEPEEAAASDAELLENGPVIVFLGDSLTAGFGLMADQALPEQVARRFDAMDTPVTVVNAGVSGDTSANGLARYDWSVSAANPDVLIIALGANDYLLGLSPDVTRANLARIIQRAQADGTLIVLAGLKPRSDALPGSRDAAFAQIYPDLAAEYDVPLFAELLAGVRDVPDLLQADGAHPTAQGVSVMADRLSAFLAPQIEAFSPQPDAP